MEEKISVKCKIEYCRISGKVIIAKLGSEEEKREMMRNKNRLKKDQFFIENDLTWEKRKTQERINIWVKKRRNKEEDVKIGFGKVRVKGIWRYWGDIEKNFTTIGEKRRGGFEEREDEENAGVQRAKEIVQKRILRRPKGRREKEYKKRKKVKMTFWNVAGLERQDKEFWDFIKEYDYVELCETWVTEEK